MNNILVVNINWLGDAIFSVPVFKALKKAHPQAKITCLCVPRVKEVLDYCPYVDKIIICDEKGKHRLPWQKLDLVWYLRKKKFDAAFLLHRSASRAWMVYLAGIPVRAGYGKFKALLSDPTADGHGDMHRSDFYVKVLEDYGIKVEDRMCDLRLKLKDMQNADVKLSAAGIREAEDFVVLNTGGNWDLKRWPQVNFLQLAQRIPKDFSLKVVFSGGLQDRENCRRLAIAAGAASVVLAGDTTLGESLALYKRARAVVSADTGPLHLASSVGAEVIGVFGPTRPEITGPRGSGRSEILFKDVGCNRAPCYHLACLNNVCMRSVTVEDVCQALHRILH